MTSSEFFMAKCEVRQFWALSGGVVAYNRPKYVNSDSSEYIISGTTNLKAPDKKFLHFNQSTVGLYAGFSKHKIRKAAVTTTDDGVRYRDFFSKKFYVHALIGSTNAGDITLAGKSYPITNSKKNPLGYRIGWQRHEGNSILGFEFGKMPGVYLDTPVKKSEIDKIFKSNPFLNFMRFTFHFTIYGGDRK